MTFQSKDIVDFLVIGSGAAGGVMAKELATAGFQVLVLEQGPYLRERDFTHDEVQTLRQSALTNDWTRQPNTFRKTDQEKAYLRPTIWYGRMVGGGSVHFTANYWRFHENDFRERSVWGAVAGADLRDWPVTYSELEPYYTKSEYELGVSGDGTANPWEPWRSKPYPLPPLPVKSSGVLFDLACRRLGLHSYPSPMAIISRPYRGRGACVQCAFCARFGCEIRAKSSSLVAVIPEAEKTGRCEIRPDSYVRKIEIDSKGRSTGVVYFDRNRREVFQRARAVIVCANGAETPRLLLMSKSKRFPMGLANTSGLVGKYLMWDSGATASGLFEHPLNDYRGVAVTRVAKDYYDSDPKRGFYGGVGIDARFNFTPINFALRGLPPDSPRWGAGYKATLREAYSHTMTLYGHTSSLAQERNSISLDPDVRDAWGLPAIRVTFSFHEDDLKTLRFAEQREREILESAGAKKIWVHPYEEPGRTTHLMGTCRMGTDPKTSVVTPDHRAHDVPNLFIVDGSSLVTCGRQQPTATIQALAYRAADRISTLVKKGNI
jgi:choline dehydrogenase-like flavoprotein